MKINIDNNNYISINKKDDISAMLSIKAKHDENGYVLVSLELKEDELDSIISELVSIRAKLK